jgi:hypothetical protein
MYRKAVVLGVLRVLFGTVIFRQGNAQAALLDDE